MYIFNSKMHALAHAHWVLECIKNMILTEFSFSYGLCSCFAQILDEMPVFYNLNATEKREVLIVILQIVRNLDDTSLVKAWQQSIARTRLFFKLMEECLILFEVVILSKIQFLLTYYLASC